jgi:hypothetical protein
LMSIYVIAYPLFCFIYLLKIQPKISGNSEISSMIIIFNFKSRKNWFSLGDCAYLERKIADNEHNSISDKKNFASCHFYAEI